eukprot:TRINITY_DN79656_c0_g1_i1.p1 TRINITY_DN79656_c0_g1~~TRINITY_DN79656_c0_g1_i1.p1  ORF type:complete len:460 (+),score=86.01 TRINITY_DN79656_c0_g1_i1:32-1411(+)
MASLLLPRRAVLPQSSPFQVTLRRWRHAGKSRFNMIRQRAMQQHVDYLRQLQPPRPARSVEVEPQLRPPTAELRTTFGHPEVTRQPAESELLSLQARPAPTLSGCIGEVELEPFGKIEVHHADIFTFLDDDPWQSKAIILPMAPNLLPYRGLGLEAFDRGGRQLVTKTFDAALGGEAGEGPEGQNQNASLNAGDTIQVSLHYLRKGASEKDQEKILFTIMPWFWEGSPMDAGKRLRDCVRKSFQEASLHFESVALPNLGGGIYGFEPKDSSRTLVEEAVEALLQIEASTPSYRLRRICFVEKSREAAESFHDALVEVSHRWLPERKLTTAPQWWGQQTRRLIVLPAAPNFFWKRVRVKFKKRHGIKKRARHDYIGNIKPWLWRAQRVQRPPPLMVYQASGEVAPAEKQLRPRPYYFRGVSHWLFPSRRGGFHSMRRSARGQWVGLLQQYKIREAVRPRM